MKFDPLVKSENNKLFRLSDGENISLENLKIQDAEQISDQTPAGNEKISGLLVKWNSVEIEPGSYNEEFLANLREYLKKEEEAGNFVFIIPSAQKELADADEADTFISAMVHTARRIKDAQSVIGFSIAREILQKDANSTLDENSYSQWFVNEMNKKHSHYVYFIKENDANDFGVREIIAKTEYILY